MEGALAQGSAGCSGTSPLRNAKATACTRSRLGLPLTVFGLCRAGVLGWWALSSVATGTVLLPFSPAQGNLVPAVAFLLIQLPLAVAGLRAIERTLVRGRV
jgi:hypothetical protein